MDLPGNRRTYLERRKNAMKRRSAWTTYSRGPFKHNLVLGDPTFCLRGRQGNYDLGVEHFKFANDENGRTYVTFVDSDPAKRRKSSIKLQRRVVITRMVATEDESCPVSISFLKNLSAADQVNLKRAVHCTLQSTTSQNM